MTYTGAKGVIYKYLTTEMWLSAWVIALLFKPRWDIKKVFDEGKNKMFELSKLHPDDQAFVTSDATDGEP